MAPKSPECKNPCDPGHDSGNQGFPGLFFFEELFCIFRIVWFASRSFSESWRAMLDITLLADVGILEWRIVREMEKSNEVSETIVEAVRFESSRSAISMNTIPGRIRATSLSPTRMITSPDMTR